MTNTTSPLPSAPSSAPAPELTLGPAQHGMWVTEQVLRPGSAHHLAVTARFAVPPDPAALEAGCARLLARHPVLASRLDPEGPALAPATGRAPELRRLTSAPDELDALLAEESARPFDLARGPLVRFALVTAGDDSPVLHAVVHHLVFDGTSKDVLLAEILGAETTADLPPNEPAEPTDEEVAAAAEFWAGRWADPAAPVLPGLPPSVRDTTAPAPGSAVPFTLDGPLHARITDTARSLGVTRFELLLALWHTLLFRYGDRAPATALELSTRRLGSPDHVGLYVNELPLLTRPDPDRPFADFVRDVRAELRALYDHRTVPLGRAVRGGLTPRTALTPLSVSYRRRTGWEAREAPDVSVDWIGFTHSVRNLAHLQLVDGPDGVDGSLQYRTDAFAPGAPARIVGHFRTLLDAVLTAPDTRLADLPLLAGDELDRALYAGNGTPAARSADATVWAMFAERAAANPSAVAVVTPDGTELSYGELHAAAEAFADRLAAAGIVPGDLVGVQVARSANELSAVLGTLAAGAAYVPLDPGYPADRLAFVRADARLAALVVEGPTPDGLPGDLPVLSPEHRGAPAPPRDRSTAPAAGDPAYVLYTSGSTGRPKGVEVPHSALANLLGALADRPAAGPEDRWLGLTSLSFDISTVELLLPLTTGARVVLVPEERQRDGAALLKLIEAHDVTHVQATPSSWRLLLAAGLHRPRLVALAGGEALPEPLAIELGACVGRLVNVYGPTETTVWSTLAELGPGDPVTIGRPLAATRAYVLDAHGRPAPDGVPGELHLGGAGVAHGYRGRSGLTAQRFVPDPWGPPGSRMYRTGDLVRRLPDGQLEFAGRVDTQVKLRGHRIELGEIEARLVEHPAVSQAVVILDRADDPGNDAAEAGQDRLVAYVVGAAQEPPAADDLRAHLARTLPAAMVPATWVPLPGLPLTPNGKVDRGRLPQAPRTRPEAAAVDGAEAAAVDGAEVAAVDGAAAVVRDIWQEVLRLDDIGPDEDLFDLGGHSLTITAIAARIRKRLGVEVPLDVFFDTPTLAEVSAVVSELQQQEESSDE
ncbi:non-ribosomal peptide synthetase [Streptomyces sp. SID14515]|uniref:non-ribosomal peptide synthetase n=1 Tax=Streptomyces sp. SID14515 TaxID=2706074 RepID=UPI0013C9C232|nr:non-ribosomal peptide synthetase [Streptomyces sp. SID14515]NEB42425.1 amino acid adenylation domain-containing protein [Streptomyces sp. SID14515]